MRVNYLGVTTPHNIVDDAHVYLYDLQRNTFTWDRGRITRARIALIYVAVAHLSYGALLLFIFFRFVSVRLGRKPKWLEKNKHFEKKKLISVFFVPPPALAESSSNIILRTFEKRPRWLAMDQYI